MSVALEDVGVSTTDELVALVDDDTKLGSSLRDPLRELVWRTASKDLPWFLETFWQVNEVGKGYTPFKLRDYQRSEAELMQVIHEVEKAREIRLKARQIGWTTLSAGYAFWSAYFHEYHPWINSAQGEDEAKLTLKLKVRQPFLLIPKWMRERGPALLDNNTEVMTFDNGSWVMSIPSTSSAGRGISIFGALLDEWAFAEQADDLLTALDPMVYGPLFIFSTANGMGNPYHKKWVESLRQDSEWNRYSRLHRPKEDFNGTFVPWGVVPNRDKKWYARELRSYRGREWAFYQEYPSSPEEAFAKTGRTALPIDLIREQPLQPPTFKLDVQRWAYDPDPKIEDYIVAPDDTADHELWVWRLPHVERDEHGNLVRRPNYVLAADVAEGLDHGDRTSITIIDVHSAEEVASYRGHWPVEDLGPLIERLGYWYHTALVGVERNNHGILPLTYLSQAAYPRLYRMPPLAQRGGTTTTRYGWHTNKATKPKMVNDFVKALKDEHIALHDDRFLEEAQTFVNDGKGGYGATSGNHDDHIISHLIGWQMYLVTPDYPAIYQDTNFRATFGDLVRVDELNKAEQDSKFALDAPIGQRRTREKVVHSFYV